jgi:hypothetical protein
LHAGPERGWPKLEAAETITFVAPWPRTKIWCGSRVSQTGGRLGTGPRGLGLAALVRGIFPVRKATNAPLQPNVSTDCLVVDLPPTQNIWIHQGVRGIKMAEALNQFELRTPIGSRPLVGAARLAGRRPVVHDATSMRGPPLPSRHGC